MTSSGHWVVNGSNTCSALHDGVLIVDVEPLKDHSNVVDEAALLSPVPS